jgi:SAM-dependent methyltransferase
VSGVMPARWYDDYERGRPGYPDRVVEVAGLAPSATVVDLAAGTGALTRQLASAFERVIAVEPDECMRRVLVASCPDVEAIEGTADRIPLPDGSVDAVHVAQAFHWFDTDEALTEIARVLRPGGALVVTWNVADGRVVPDIASVEDLLAPIWPQDFGFPLDMMSGDWAPDVWAGPLARRTFEPVREERLANPQTVDPDGLLAFFGSMGWIASLPDTARHPLIAAMRRDLSASHYVLPWQTRIQWTRLRSTAETPAEPGRTSTSCSQMARVTFQTDRPGPRPG